MRVKIAKGTSGSACQPNLQPEYAVCLDLNKKWTDETLAWSTSEMILGASIAYKPLDCMNDPLGMRWSGSSTVHHFSLYHLGYGVFSALNACLFHVFCIWINTKSASSVRCSHLGEFWPRLISSEQLRSLSSVDCSHRRCLRNNYESFSVQFDLDQ